MTPAFATALTATGYLRPDGSDAEGLFRSALDAPPRVRALLSHQRAGLRLDGVFTSQRAPASLFKDSGERQPTEDEFRAWHEAGWNISVAPLLWVVSPVEVRLYDCFAKQPRSAPKGGTHLARAELGDTAAMARLDSAAGRFATETSPNRGASSTPSTSQRRCRR